MVRWLVGRMVAHSLDQNGTRDSQWGEELGHRCEPILDVDSKFRVRTNETECVPVMYDACKFQKICVEPWVTT